MGWVNGGRFGAGSDGFYDASVNIGPQWGKAKAVVVGYREYDVDYANGSFLYDVKQDGWGIGLVGFF